MKKLFAIALLFVVTLGAHAQFDKGTKFVGASLSSSGLSYGKTKNFNFGIQAEAGYFFADNWMALANFGFEYQGVKGEGDTNEFNMGVMARYYFNKIGIFAAAGAEYNHYYNAKVTNDFRIPLEVGYCFYLNDKVAVEPAVYYKPSLIDFSENSEVGLRIGFTYYF